MTLQEQKLECQLQDATALKAAISKYANTLTAPHDASQDALEQACLKCQEKDAAQIRSVFTRFSSALVGIYQSRDRSAHA